MFVRRHGLKRVAVVLAAGGMLGSLMVSAPMVASAQESTVTRAAEGKLQLPTLIAGNASRRIQGISSGTLTAAKRGEQASPADVRANAAVATNAAAVQPQAVTQGSLGCRTRNPDGNVRVNQDCTFRGQAEEIIKINPTDSNNLIAGQNDSRIGYNKCGFDYSFDAGQSWGDGLPPFSQRENHPEVDGSTNSDHNHNTLLGGTGTGHTYDAASDPAETFDSEGRAFFGCVLFDHNDNASGIFVTQSPAGAGGAFYDNLSPTDRNFVVVEDNTPNVLHDKDFIAADAFPGSPNRDNVYVTWTVFRMDASCAGATPALPGFCSSAIYGSMSTDHGLTWSTPEEISGTSSTLCFFATQYDPSRSEHACDLDQGADPQPMPDGSLVVPFFNQNTPPGDINDQELDVICHPSGSSTSATAHLNCGSPNRSGRTLLLTNHCAILVADSKSVFPGPGFAMMIIRALQWTRATAISSWCGMTTVMASTTFRFASRRTAADSGRNSAR